MYPIGIDPEKFSRELAKPDVRARSASLRNDYGDTRIIVGVDRLDYIKGLPRKLDAFDRFLSKNPEWVGKVTLVQVAVPSRENIPEYQELANTLNKLADNINLKHGRKKLFVLTSLATDLYSQLRLRWLPAHKPPPLQHSLRRTRGALRRSRRVPHLINPRWHESSRL